MDQLFLGKEHEETMRFDLGMTTAIDDLWMLTRSRADQGWGIGAHQVKIFRGINAERTMTIASGEIHSG
jgi:hypothetical protein